MSTEVYSRKATFKEVKKGVFTPVNRRAHIVVKKLHHRSKVTLEELKSCVGKGSYTFWAYTNKGELKAIKF